MSLFEVSNTEVSRKTITLGGQLFASYVEGNRFALVRESLIRSYPQLSTDIDAAFRDDMHDGGPLAGRGAVRTTTLSCGRCVVIRPYRRGGLLRHFTTFDYVSPPGQSLARSRPIHELLVLAVLESAGVSSVRPQVAVAARSGSGAWSYRGALVTEAVPEAQMLVAVRDSQAFVDFSYKTGSEASRMLAAGVLHIDLHPGNVLIDGSGRIVLLDFDKARLSDATLLREQAIDMLVARWKRALRKYELPAAGVDAFADGLQRGGERV